MLRRLQIKLRSQSYWFSHLACCCSSRSGNLGVKKSLQFGRTSVLIVVDSWLFLFLCWCICTNIRSQALCNIVLERVPKLEVRVLKRTFQYSILRKRISIIFINCVINNDKCWLQLLNNE